MVTPLPQTLPIPATGPIDTSPIVENVIVTPELQAIWALSIPYLRVRGNDIHLPMTVAYAERLCRAHPDADARVVRVATLMHDLGWARCDEDKLISEGFAGDWRRADIRFEHERQGCLIAQEILSELGYEQSFIDEVNAIIDGHDTRQVAHSYEDALMRDADRMWRFNHVGIALAGSWFGKTPAAYTDRLVEEIVPELLTEAGHAIASAELERSNALLLTGMLR